MSAIDQALERLRVGVANLDPDVVDGPTASRLVEQLAEIVRLGEAGKAIMIRQVQATASWSRSGYFRDAATWLASVSGTSVGAARATLETADRLTELPTTESAMRAGRLSAPQANALTEAAIADPTAERGLLQSAEHDGPKAFNDRCARVTAAARRDEMANHERIRRARSVRNWEDRDGTGRIDVRGPVGATARIMAALVPYEKELFEAARARDRDERERPEAHAFDALVAMAAASTGDGAPARRADTTLVVRMDVGALRGWTEPGEVCEIEGSGPIPAAVALRMAQGAFIKAVVTDGIDVHSVLHLGRKPPAILETALRELYGQCAVEGCDVARHLETDHNVPWSEGGETRLSNLHRVCPFHHRYKHKHNLRLVGEGTNKRFVPAAGWTGNDPPSRR